MGISEQAPTSRNNNSINLLFIKYPNNEVKKNRTNHEKTTISAGYA